MESNNDHNPAHYKFGIFYHHKENPKLFILKADGLGWTLNFANNWSYLVLLLILASSAVCIMLGLRQKK